MTTWRLIFRSLRFYLRGHLGVVAGVAVGTAVLVGALAVGDSVKFSLEAVAERRLGEVTLAVASPERFFRAELADEIAGELDAGAAPVIHLNATAVNSETHTRANRLGVLGVDKRFWRLGGADVLLDGKASREVVLNEPLARRLGVRPGDSIVLRIRKPGLMPNDAPMSGDAETAVAMRLTVKAVASESQFGRFSLRAEQVAPMTAFVPLEILQSAIDRPGRANMLLLGKGAKINPKSAGAAMRKHWKLADAELEVRELPGGYGEFRTDRVFIEHPVEQAAKKIIPSADGILTYFVTEIRCGKRKTPYSMVTAMGPLGNREETQGFEPLGLEHPGLSFDIKDDEININKWLADDLQAKVGDEIELEYFVISPTRKLQTRTSKFRVRRITSMDVRDADRELMPKFPGITGVKNCKDWKPGKYFDPRRVRDKDEDYWNRYGGTPKAFVTLRAGKKMWSNRFGGLTAIRFPLSTVSSRVRGDMLRAEIDPASVGLFFRPVRAEAVAAGKKSLNFGSLFLGMSFFLMASAALLVGLLFVFGVQQRSEQVGTLLAMGFRPGQVRRLMLAEGGVLALIGGVIGTFAGLMYTKAIILGLGTVWTGAAAGTSTIRFGVEPMTLAVGGVSGVLIALAAMWITLRGQMTLSARQLLTGGRVAPSSGAKRSEAELVGALLHSSSSTHNLRSAPVEGATRHFGLWFGLVAVGAAVAILAVSAGNDRYAPTVFFAAGAVLLIGSLAFVRAWISRLSRSVEMTLAGLSMRNTGRRPGRSLATVALLACGVFLIVAVGANRKNPLTDTGKSSSPTGGFALYGESALPVPDDLDETEGVRFRIHDGDDASCLNLNRPQRPRIMGVEPGQLRGRFTFAKTIGKTDDPWRLLNRIETDGATPAVADQATIVWALGKSVGDTLAYTDERGKTFRIRLVGALAGSILQGGLIISERNFTGHFGSESGYRAFLIDAPPSEVESLTRTLTADPGLADVGLELTPTTDRLAAFYAVRNTYLSIFQALGSLGLLLGSVGLGVVVLRNVLERRGELALLQAVGFSRSVLYRMVLYEHSVLLAMGLLCGSLSGFVAVIPVLRSSGGAVPGLSLLLTLAAVACGGILWIYLATASALRGEILSALRGE